MSSRQSVLLCDRCGARYTLTSLPKGGRFRCRNCGKAFQIELDDPEPATRELRRAAVKAGLEPLTGPVSGPVVKVEDPASPPATAATPSAAPQATPTAASEPAARGWDLDVGEDESARARSDEPGHASHEPTDGGAGDGGGSDEMLFGRYSIEGELGRGEMGVVYRAVERTTGRKVALKTLLPGVTLGREGTLRFGREARAIERLRPAGLVPLLDHGESYETRYLVSELALGTPSTAPTRRSTPTRASRYAWSPSSRELSTRSIARACCTSTSSRRT
ncbi:MAG: hypothetical protein IPK07_27620 [Deltaproteobacteria bacterium]|nr:hypothetical protein [Deltaproteobacteria bacterium]